MKIRTGYFSEVNRDNAFQVTKDMHEPQLKRVYAALLTFKDGEATRWQLSEATGIPIHLICARVKELMDNDAVIDTEKSIVNEETKVKNTIIKIKQPNLFYN